MKLVRFTLVAAAVLGVTPAAADGDLTTAEATQRMGEGRKLYSERQYEAAWLKYREACVVLNTEACTRGLAVTEYKAGKYLDAYGHLKQLLEPTPKPSITPDMVDGLTQMMKDAYGKIGHLEITAPEGTTISVDGKYIGRTPLRAAVDVATGPHDVEGQLDPRGRATQVHVDAVAGQSTPVRVEAPAAPTPTEAPVPPVTRPEHEVTALPVEEGPAHSTGEYVLVGGLAVAGVASLVASGLFGKASTSNHDAAVTEGPNRPCNHRDAASCADFQSKIDSANRDRTLSTVTGIAGGALLAGAVVTGVVLFALPKASRPQGVWVAPSLQPRSASIEAGLRF